MGASGEQGRIEGISNVLFVNGKIGRQEIKSLGEPLISDWQLATQVLHIEPAKVCGMKDKRTAPRCERIVRKWQLGGREGNPVSESEVVMEMADRMENLRKMLKMAE